MAWIALIAAPGMTYWHMIAPLVIAGAGISMAIPAAQNAVMNAVGAGRPGQGVGRLHDDPPARRRVRPGDRGGRVRRRGSYASPGAFGDGFVPALAVSGVLAAAGALVAASLPRRDRAVEFLRTAIERDSRPPAARRGSPNRPSACERVERRLVRSRRIRMPYH